MIGLREKVIQTMTLCENIVFVWLAKYSEEILDEQMYGY